ncbi:MAG TPA: CBS domain-containing protein, partial [Thermoanaerobaculia bacterium]
PRTRRGRPWPIETRRGASNQNQVADIRARPFSREEILMELVVTDFSAPRIKDVMTPSPACCIPETPLVDVARMLVEHDCGAIPVVDDRDSGRPVGIVTDRDIACRAVAGARDIRALRARDCMSTPCIAAPLDLSLEDCCRLMEAHRLRRIVIVDDSGACCGIVAQADIALRGPGDQAARVVRGISVPTAEGSDQA